LAFKLLNAFLPLLALRRRFLFKSHGAVLKEFFLPSVEDGGLQFVNSMLRRKVRQGWQYYLTSTEEEIFLEAVNFLYFVIEKKCGLSLIRYFNSN
jgi:hypothetical protein